jgi:uncharacterized membrane protein YvbJ
MYCLKCGSEIGDDSIFCSKCGARADIGAGRSGDTKNSALVFCRAGHRKRKRQKESAGGTRFSATVYKAILLFCINYYDYQIVSVGHGRGNIGHEVREDATGRN